MEKISTTFVHYPVKDIQVPPDALPSEVLEHLESISNGNGGKNKIPMDRHSDCPETGEKLIHINGHDIRVNQEWAYSEGGNGRNIIATALAFHKAALRAGFNGWTSPDIAHSGESRLALAIPKGEKLKRTITVGQPYDQEAIERFVNRLGLEGDRRIVMDTLVLGVSRKVEQLIVPSSKTLEHCKRNRTEHPLTFFGINGGEAQELLGQDPYEGLDLENLEEIKGFIERYLPKERKKYATPTLLHSLELFRGAKSIAVFGFGTKRYLCVAPLDFDLSARFAEELGLNTKTSALYTIGCGDSQVGSKNEVENLYGWLKETDDNEHPEKRAMKTAMRLSFAASSAVLRLKDSNLEHFSPEKNAEMIKWSANPNCPLPVKILEF